MNLADYMQAAYAPGQINVDDKDAATMQYLQAIDSQNLSQKSQYLMSDMSPPAVETQSSALNQAAKKGLLGSL